MSGLECSEISISDINTKLFRLEAEFYQKSFLLLWEKIVNFEKLNKLSTSIECGPFGSNLLDTNYIEDGVTVIRPFNLKNSVVEDDNLVFISEETVKQNRLKMYNYGDLLFSRVGDIKCGLLNKKQATISPNIIAVRLKDKKYGGFLAIYFSTYFGFKQIERQLKVAAQPTISTKIIGKLRIPNLSKGLVYKITELHDTSQNIYKNAESKYQEANKQLLNHLNLSSHEISEDNISIKNFSESFLDSGRLDAEYYQPKYDELIEIIKKNKFKRLGDIVEIKKSIEPGSSAYQEDGIPFVRVADLTKYEITMPQIHLDRKEFEKEELKPKKNTILLTKDGSCGIAYKVDEDMDIITSGAILHLNVIDSEVLPDYLTLVLNSITTKMQSERDAGGSIIQHWKPSEIEEVLIPILPVAIQEEIDKGIIESHKLRRKSKQLLEDATKAVEIAIEFGEEKAMEFLEEENE